MALLVLTRSPLVGPPQHAQAGTEAAASDDDDDDEEEAEDRGEVDGDDSADVSELAEGVKSLNVAQPKAHKKVFGLQLSGLPDGTTEGEVAHHAHLVPPKAIKVRVADVPWYW